MQPEPRQDRSALRWIRGELDQSLREARVQLEEFAEGREGIRLDGTADSLHQIHGALEMVQVYGGAMLADEMEQLARAMAGGALKHPAAAAEVLMLGVVQLPAYLEKVEAGGADIPLVLLPLMNDLRAAREAPLVSETSLFAPKLNAVIAAETVRPGSGNRDMPRLIHQYRSHFHRGLLNWIREQHIRESLTSIRDVLDVLNSAAGTARMRRLLDAAEALAIAMLDEQEAPSLAVKPLFGKLDRVFKRVIDQGEESAMLDFPVDLLKNLLYYIARSHSNDPAVLSVKQAVDLVNSFPDQTRSGAAVSSLGAPDRELFAAVGEALAQDLRDVKDQLDLYIRGDRSNLDRLTGLAPPIRRIGDTLGMVGRGDLRSRLKHRCDELDAAGSSGVALDEDRLMALASELLLVESSLAGLASGEAVAHAEDDAEISISQLLSEGEMRQHQRAAIDEALVELAHAKDDILEYLEHPDQRQRLEGVPPRLHLVAGVMSMLDQPEAGRLLHDLKPYIVRLGSAESVTPDMAQRDALADVVMSAELYMQTVVEPGTDRASLLEFGDRALRVLGLRGVEEVSPSPDIAAEFPDAGPEAVVVPPSPESTGDAAYVEAVVDEPNVAPVAPIEEIPQAEDQQAASATEDIGAEEPAQDQSATPVANAAAAEAQQAVGDEIDSEILEVFAEEAEEELGVIQRCLPQWLNNPDDRDALTTTRRSFHTLKGSGRIVGATNLGEFAWSIENLLNRVIDGTVPATPDVTALLDEAGRILPDLVAESRGSVAQATDVSVLSERAFALASGASSRAEATAPQPAVVESAPEALHEELPPPVEESIDSATPETLDAVADLQEPLSIDAYREPGDESLLVETTAERTGFHAVDEGADATRRGADESILTAEVVEDSEFAEHETLPLGSVDTSLNAVFVNEASGHLNVLDDFVSQCASAPGGRVMEAGVRRAMHTLCGSARTAGFDAIAMLAGALEALTEALQNGQQPIAGQMLDLLNRSHRMLSQIVGAIDDGRPEPGDWQPLCDEVRDETTALHAPTVEQAFAHTGEAADDGPDPELLEVFLDEAKELLEMLEQEMGAWERVADDEPVVRLQRNLHTMKGGARLAGVMGVGDLSHALESVFQSVAERRVVSEPRLKRLVRHATDTLAQDIEYLLRGELPQSHPHMVERLESAAHGREWEEVGADEAAIDDESAFAVSSILDDESGVEAVDEFAESAFEPETAEIEAAEVETAQAAIDEPDPGVTTALEEPETPEAVPEPADLHELADLDEVTSALLTDSQLMTDSELLDDSGFAVMDAVAQAGAQTEGSVVQFPSGEVLGDDEGFVPRKPLPDEPRTAAVGSERVRVASEALDQMVNNAGEVSIYRARIEQQNSSFAFNLGELQQTIDRLRSQLRGLELETEAQILSRHERDTETRADFDPLELDRYSTIQQLSRALSETVEDLSNLGQSLNDLSRDTDTLLLQQARVTTDLQDSLLRTRMVRFGSRAPRLERVVRQTSHSVGKRAELNVVGGGEDMDRAILERMMGPLEHLLRNAVSHGIENADERTAAGKPATGTITLQLAREGTDVVLSLSDDGAGLDRDRIRSKAIERGLLKSDADITDDDLYQLILQPGFSTAQELSQVSGRGVGMDVVLTEVKQLGGTLDIDSQPGQGTRFTIRLPFTLAITDALLVSVSEDVYAVPHSSMDGVARVGVDELQAIYAGKQDTISYGGRDYNVRYLGTMLGLSAVHIAEGARWLPLLLVRSGDNRIAIQVDGLLGNRQIVVKSIGIQLSGVRWFTGGTILADGQIALILDVNAVLRMDTAHQPTQSQEMAAPLSKGVSVMVVDDSITVRKVTSRLLERHNMQVVTAKDGVDAVTVLQDHHPDVMLLDIEMPRMDGFELARHMRSTPELSDIPIIMITSRTGDKHRNRAFELGVKRYLGKPYQESDLLENIYTVLAEISL